METLVTIKIKEETRKLLRQIAAETGEQMIEVVQRVLASELKKVRNEAKKEREVPEMRIEQHNQ